MPRAAAVLAACLLSACASFKGLNGIQSGAVSRALAVLPKNRGEAGTISFKIDSGPHAGVQRCQVLGRGQTSKEPKPGWVTGRIGWKTIYYAPMDAPDGATIPGVYDLRIISPDTYEIEPLDKPEDSAGAADFLSRIKSPDSAPKPHYSGVFKHWYSTLNRAAPIDLVWAEDRLVFERKPQPSSPEGQARMAKQLAANPDYYKGPYGRSGFAIHTDQWEDPDRLSNPAYAGRPELSDFRWRDTDGCLKVRPCCLELLDEFVAEQEKLGRRVQCEVRER